MNDAAALDGGFMRADSGAGPVDRLINIGERWAVLHNAGNELMHEVRVRAAVSTTLNERKMRVLFVIDALGREGPNRLGKQSGVIGYANSRGVFSGMHDRL